MWLSCGYRVIEVSDEIQKTNLTVAFLYPALAQERTERFGPYSVDVAKDAGIADTELSLIVLSHGNGGTPWAYRDMAKHLARSGYVVALPEHAGNSRNDNSLENTVTNLENRPRHVSLTIDAAFADPLIGPHLLKARVGVIGHSIGAYAALAAAGGTPWAAPRETPDRLPRSVNVQPDSRVSALVLLMPATFWFVTDSLKEVNVPILIRTGSKDTITPSSHAETIIRGVAAPSLVQHEVILGAGHFSAMSKFPAALTSPTFPPSQDPDGFDREAYQPKLFADVERFLTTNLTSPRPS
jgi:predicted dienelactone hydrolase